MCLLVPLLLCSLLRHCLPLPFSSPSTCSTCVLLSVLHIHLSPAYTGPRTTSAAPGQFLRLCLTRWPAGAPEEIAQVELVSSWLNLPWVLALATFSNRVMVLLTKMKEKVGRRRKQIIINILFQCSSECFLYVKSFSPYIISMRNVLLLSSFYK